MLAAWPARYGEAIGKHVRAASPVPALHPGSCERGRRRIGNDDRTVDDAAGSGVATRATSDVTTRLSNELTLRGFTLVTATDYVVYAMTTPGIGRAVCIGNTARQVQVALADDSGQPVPQSIKDQYIAGVNADRLINVQVTIEDPTYTPISVIYHIIMWPGFDAAQMVSEANAALAEILSPANYGRPETGRRDRTGSTTRRSGRTGWSASSRSS